MGQYSNFGPFPRTFPLSEKGRMAFFDSLPSGGLGPRKIFYGLKPMPPSRVSVSPERYLKSSVASRTHTRPISVSGSP